MEQKVRMADIAEKLGISVVSVSKALSGKDGISDRLREKIRQTAQEMGYAPLRSKPAQAVQPEGGNIGILVCDYFFDDNTFYASLYRQLALLCSELGFAALLEIVPAEARRTCQIPAILQGKKVCGLIFLGQFNREYLNAVTHQGIPHVLLDFYDEELDAISVTSDNVTGGYRLTRHILNSGKTDIGFVGSIGATSSIMDRFLGYCKALMSAGIAVRKEWVLEDRYPDGTMRPITLPDPMPQAFVCCCDQVAYDLVEQLQHRGYRVPEDVAVSGYDDYRLSLLSRPRLTSYRVNVEQLSAIAVNQLVSAIRGEPTIKGNIVVNGVLIPREST